MIIGRAAELRQIDGLLEAERAGTGGALLMRGEPGVGKSTLLEQARARADDMLVLSARGIESDSELPFVSLHELLRPLLGRLGSLPEQQAAALSASLQVGPPTASDRFTVAAATLGLLDAAAAEGPVLMLVDDVPWLDSATGETLRVVLRLLSGNPVAALLAAREGEPTALDDAGLPELHLVGLAPGDARELLAGVVPGVASRLIEETRGNPLALKEVWAMLTREQALGVESLPEPIPAGAAIARAFRRRLVQLPPATTRALVVAAASQRDEAELLWRALARLGSDETALADAEEAGVIQLEGGRLAWRHPLLRAAAYHGAAPADRRLAHRALAEACPAQALGERAWHLAAAATRPDEHVGAALVAAAVDARRRSGFGASARAFARAAELSPDREPRARRLLEAADDLRALGQFERARSLLDESARMTRDALLAADIELRRGVIEMWTGDAERAVALLLAETERVELLDPERAAKLLLEAGLAVQMSGHVPRLLAVVRRLEALAPTDEVDARCTADLLLNALVLAGEGPPPDVLREQLRQRVIMTTSRGEALYVISTVLHMLVWIDEHELARRICERELEAANTAGALERLPFLNACLCEVDFRTGQLAAAHAAGVRSARLAEETEQLNMLSFSLVSLARVEAVLGQVAECRAHLDRALELARLLNIGSIEVFALSVLGLLELGLNHVDDALGSLERLAVLVDAYGLREPGVVQWRADLVEALVLSGQRDAARAALAVLEEQAARTERKWALGAAARCRGMLAEEGFEREFEQALEWHAGFSLEQARSQLRLGERLRRARRLVEARAPLRAALESFEALGAEPWASRARAELQAARGRVGRANGADREMLTAQEFEVARLVAAGATNREAAASLFLSAKTVEFHLTNAYRKLGVRSRAELTRVLSQDGLTGPARPVGPLEGVARRPAPDEAER